MNCKQCGTELTQTEGRRKKEFCGSTCRSNFWYNNTKKKVPKYVISKPQQKHNVEEPSKEPPILTATQWIEKRKQIEDAELYDKFLVELDAAYYLSDKQKHLIKTAY